ncbi:MAG TPA: cyclic beta 1-2 glucan synthetase, partial [Agriterribacter sp.]|nr:cyclic beta 1-2 glucan synthetase [Agriterribacter sp.]
MNSPYQKRQNKDVLSDLLPQAISVLKKTIIAPLFSDNLFHKYANEKPPLRSELFTHQQMEHHAKRLAAKHILTKGEPSEKMLKRLGENESLLMEIHKLLAETVKSNAPIAPAGEWLLDNFYLIEDHIYTGKKHLPKGYSKGLPQLGNGASEGMPRVYDIIVELISHSDGRVDFESLSGFINAYQSVTVLQLGELWAIPIMLRLALIENLRRLSTEIALDILHKNLANFWADQMLETLDNDPKNLVVVIADMARSKPPIEGAFVAELTRKLQGRGAALSLPLSWIEQFVSDTALTSDEMVHLENQKQAAQQVSVSNSINSLRFLNNTNWRRFVEQESIVEKILNEDIDGLYGKMDFYTRDHYRHVVEKISKYSAHSEVEVAAIAIEQAKQYQGDERKQHVGYHLIGTGAIHIEKLAKVKLPFKDKLKRSFARIPLFYYLLSIGLLTILFCWILTSNIDDALRNWQYALLLFVCAIAASQPAIALFNWISTLITRPDPLPRMDFSSGIPQNQRTLVVVPTMLLHTEGVDELTEAMEVRFVANRDDHLHFALLTDFKDAATQCLPGEDQLLEYAKNKIIELNKKYGQADPVIFMLFHRPRKWNAKENVWMGYERKRGKLEELNKLLQGKD